MSSPKDKPFILIVEDDEVMARGIADVLSFEGYHVETASNGRIALAKMRARTPDLLLSDIMMPEMNGHEFCAMVRTSPTWRTLPFIFLTALGQRINHRRGMELGADGYLTKPFEPDDLLVAVSTRLKRAADHRAASDAALADLRASILTTLNHEFRTPLTYITGYSRLLSESGREMDESSFQGCLHALLNGAERLRQLVENVLLVTQIESGELAATAKMFPQHTQNLNAIAQTVIKYRQSQAEKRRAVVHNQIPTALPPLVIGEEYMTQIINHLLDNAIKFTKPQGGQVTLAVTAQEYYADLTVNDDGIGIRPDALTWIFDTFRQVDRSKQEQQGAGLGLTIVRGLVQAHDGQVSIESELGVGTTVSIRLPTS